MRGSPLFLGIVYILLGIVFTFWAIRLVNTDGWGLLAYLLLFIATIDIGGGIRLIGVHFKTRKNHRS